MKTNREAHNDHKVDNHDFGAVDKYGRAIGARIVRCTITYTPLPDDAVAFWRKEPGTYFAWWPQATRNGEKYGALQPENLCATPEEREAAIAKYLDGARKRAAKLAKVTR